MSENPKTVVEEALGRQVEVVDASPVAAHVYRRGCSVTYRGVADVKAGQNEVRIDCVPKGIEVGSVRLRIPEGVEIMSVDIEVLPGRPVRSDELVGLEHDLALAKRMREARKLQRAMWLSPSLTNESGEAVSAMVSYIDGLGARLDGLDEEILLLDERIDELDRQRDILVEKEQEQAHRLDQGVVRARVQATQDGPMPFEVALRSTAARWEPVYDVFADDFASPIRLRTRAMVTQFTGHDWKGVRISLSTLAPSLGGRLPELVPRKLRRRPPVVQRTERRSMLGMSPVLSSMARGSDYDDSFDDSSDGDDIFDETAMLSDDLFEQLVDRPMVEAERSDAANGIEYELPGEWDVAVNQLAMMELSTEEIPARFEWRAVPAMDTAVHIVALLDEELDPQAAGQLASMHIAGEYCGRMTLPVASPTRKPMLSLGPDAKVSTFRRVVERKASKAFLGGQQNVFEEIEVGVRNGRSEEIGLVILDQVPVSEEKDVTVDVKNAGGAGLNAETGELRWELSLPAGSEAKRKFSFSVSRPKNADIIGL